MPNDTRQQSKTRTAGADMRQPGVPNGQALAEHRAQTPTMSAADAARDKLRKGRQFFIDRVIERRDEIQRALQASGVDYDSFMAALEIGLTQAVNSDDKFVYDVEITSFIDAVLRAAYVGIRPDGKEGAIVRYANRASFLPMVEGYIKVLWATGTIKDINHNVVCDGDHFEFREGDNGFIDHQRSLTRAADAKVIGAWCIINMNEAAGGGRMAEIVDQAELEKIAKVSRATRGPRVDWQREMHRKAPFRRLVKRLPKTERLIALISADDANFDLTAPAAKDPAAPAAVPKNSIFSGRVAVPRKAKSEQPAIEAPAHAETAADVDDTIEHVEIIETSSAAATPATPEEFIKFMAEVDSAIEFGEACLALEASPEAQEWPEAQQLAVLKAIDQAKKRLGIGEEAGEDGGDGQQQPFVLTAILRSSEGERHFDSADTWRDDILVRMASLKGDALATFWKVNRSLVLAAREQGYPLHAGKVLEAAAHYGLKVE